ncbi:hypothetical protein FRACYDRAFT_238745 [Fragilariopsis cylindrus CCMP1102]|uniref:Uncharacterized protein n=1 Tax=Fragilariopsis cylindrus CCMP1102 TaxID=635003 RepID=A0A1E7FDC3_9STRA|nr:hypothetical protein FRACYDRAFT_238745 [Fragilariopsis cylindrus CCMP1102]|eukprot:OEU16157.1 hypothetical protein FRACYDRAFT_238745 [Fragilariopsis cylindrus CCMP1102]
MSVSSNEDGRGGSNSSSAICKEDALGKNIELELSSFDEDGNKECRIGTITRMKVSFPNDDVPSNFNSNKNNQSLLDYKHYIKFVDYPGGWYNLSEMMDKDLFNNLAASSSVSTATSNGNPIHITPEKKRKRSSSTATTATGSSSLWKKKEKKNEDKNGNQESVHQRHQLQPHLPKKKKKTARNNDDDDNAQQGTNYQEGNNEINTKEFEDWLRKCKSTSGKEQRPISDSNARSVINRVKDLTSGRGIGYKNWPADIRFCGPTDSIRKGPITLEYNLHSLLQDAKEFENKHGRDKGNGWLVQHPVKKLILYKDYITECREKNHVFIE